MSRRAYVDLECPVEEAFSNAMVQLREAFRHAMLAAIPGNTQQAVLLEHFRAGVGAFQDTFNRRHGLPDTSFIEDDDDEETASTTTEDDGILPNSPQIDDDDESESEGSERTVWPTRPVMMGVDQVCHICMSGYVAGNVVRTLPCIHAFHCDCIDQWLRVTNACPLCKLDLTAYTNK